MMELLLGNIPRFYTALADWLACILYIGLLRLRFKGMKLWAIAIVALVSLGSFMVITGDVPVQWFIPCIITSILIMLIFIYACCNTNLKTAGYFCARAFILGELAASLEWQIYYYLYSIGFTSLWGEYLVLAFIYILVFGIMFILERSHKSETQALTITFRELCSVVVIAAAIYFMSNLSYVYTNTPFSSQIPSEIFNTRTMVDLGGVSILYAYHVQVSALHMKFEMNALNNILRSQYTQYQQFKMSIEHITQKYHDIKHQIDLFRSECDPEQKNEFLNCLENDIMIYDAQNQTGCRVLDTILTGKSLYCRNRNINLTCVADGAVLEPWEVVDLCTLFGNALDNAIEAVEQVEDSEKKLIHLSVSQQKDFIRIRVENYYEGDLLLEEGWPITTKEDKQFHGYGLKSIRQIAEKYGGSVTISTKKNWFELRILAPVKNQTF